MADPSPSRTRRELVLGLARAAGVAPFALGILDGSAAAGPRDDATDLAILDAAVALEEQAIALYTVGLKNGLFPAGLRAYATEFRGDHVGHRDTQISIVRERGGDPPRPPGSEALGGLQGGDAMIHRALGIEVAAQEAYTALVSQIRSRDYLLSAAFILVDEVRHMTVWRRVLGFRIY